MSGHQRLQLDMVLGYTSAYNILCFPTKAADQ